MGKRPEQTLWDAIIVGQGLAGTTLGWAFKEAGARVLFIDPDHPVTSSRVAAGLITPVVGQRLALNWGIETFLPVARSFYRRIEEQTGASIFFERDAIRLLATQADLEVWKERQSWPAFADHLRCAPPSLSDLQLRDTYSGAFAMRATQLDVSTYLAVSRTHFPVVRDQLDWHHDVSFEEETVFVKGESARCVISCEGFRAADNPYFSWVPFSPVKGEILTVRFNPDLPPVCLHKDVWVAPGSAPGSFRVGATYDRTNFAEVPTEDGRSELVARLQDLTERPFSIVDHHAAVRPIVWKNKALIGVHPHHPQLGFFNGLGSKGALQAPWFAETFARHLLRNEPIPDEAHLLTKFVP